MACLVAALPFHGEERRGEPMTIQHREIRTVARVTRLHWPGGVWEWHRPVAVEVRERGEVRRIPIRNATRGIVVALTLVSAIIGAQAVRRRRTDRSKSR